MTFAIYLCPAQGAFGATPPGWTGGGQKTFAGFTLITYLRQSGFPENPHPPVIVDLAANGFAPGDTLRITSGVTAFTPHGGHPGADADGTPIIGVFSGSETLLPRDQLLRVPDAIDAGSDVITPPTHFESLPTDIPQDFRIFPPRGFFIEVPAGATHLFIGLNDSFFADNGGFFFVTLSRVEERSCIPAPEGLVAWYPFDEDGSDTVGSRDGTLSPGTSIVPEGQVGSGANFDGTSGGVSLPDDAFAGLSSGTIASWILVDTSLLPEPVKSILSAHGTISSNQNILNFRAEGVHFPIGPRMTVRPAVGDLLEVRTDSGVLQGRWHHVAYTSDATGNKLVVDGQVSTHTYSAGLSTTQAYFSNISGVQKTVIGAFIANDGSPVHRWNGVIDELTVFNRALSTTELRAIFDAGVGGLCRVEDTDEDGAGDDVDNCPATANPDQADGDGDGIGDVCDVCAFDPDNDLDQDGICAFDEFGTLDNCPELTNSDQIDTDKDGAGDACDVDDDNDTVLDAADNCPVVVNADQADFDADGVGDACDNDVDGDGVIGGDICLFTPIGEVVNSDGCSIPDLCPCENEWKNHGAYVSCVAHAAEEFVGDGLITDTEKDAIVSEAAESTCGDKNQ